MPSAEGHTFTPRMNHTSNVSALVRWWLHWAHTRRNKLHKYQNQLQTNQITKQNQLQNKHSYTTKLITNKINCTTNQLLNRPKYKLHKLKTNATTSQSNTNSKSNQCFYHHCQLYPNSAQSQKLNPIRSITQFQTCHICTISIPDLCRCMCGLY